MEKNKRSKRNKKILAGAGALACIALLAGTYAWLQSEDEKTNKFTGILAGNSVEVDELWEEPGDWTPGQSVIKQAGALNTGEYDEFIRVSFREAIALLDNANQIETETPLTEPPAFFDPLDKFYGFSVEIDANGDIVGIGKNAEEKTKNKKDFVDFLAAYGQTVAVKKGEDDKYTPEYTDMDGKECEYGWLIPVSEDTVALYGEGRPAIPENSVTGEPAKPAIDGKKWTPITISANQLPADYTLPAGYTLKGFQSPGETITNQNNGTSTTVYNYFFYWETTVDGKTKYYEAQVDSTETNKVSKVVTLKDAPKFVSISAKYQKETIEDWMDKAPTLTFNTPGTANAANGTYFGDTNPITGDKFEGLVVPTADNQKEFGYWQQQSAITGLSLKDNNGDPLTNQRAQIGIDFVNVLPTTQTLPTPTVGQGVNRWVYNQADGYFYYLNVVKSGQKTANIINSVKLLDDANNAYMKVRYNLDVKAEAVQAIGEAVESEWLKGSNDNLSTFYKKVAPRKGDKE